MLTSPEYITRWTPFYNRLVPEKIRHSWLCSRIMRIVRLKPELYPMLLEVSKDEDKWTMFIKELEKSQLKGE